MDSSSSSNELDYESHESAPRLPVSVKGAKEEEIFRCETQMITSYVRFEQKDPMSREVVKVLHAFSFCNHTDLPDNMLEDVIREKWEDLFSLTGSLHSSLADKWPERINIVNEPGQGTDKCFQQSRESEDSCSHCDITGLKNLTRYHLKRELESVAQIDPKKDENENNFSGISK